MQSEFDERMRRMMSRFGALVGVAATLAFAGQSANQDDLTCGSAVSIRRTALSRRIVSHMGIVEFRVPRSAPIKVSKDVDYVTYHIQYGEGTKRRWLTMMFGPLVGGETPPQAQDTSIVWTASRWSCSGIEGGDWRGTAADGRRWRHIHIPLSGFVAYEGVTPKAAEYFDKILASMCCGKCAACK